MEALTTRTRLVVAMADTLQRRGLHGVGLTEMLAQAQAPKGVLYHHFPGGKNELAVAAIEDIVQRMVTALDKLFAAYPDPMTALQRWIAGAQRQLDASGFERGCPLATVALESTPDDTAIRAALAVAFARIRDRLSQALATSGVEAQRAKGLAALIVAAYEGGLLQARVAGNSDAMTQVTSTLLALLEPQLETRE